MSNLYDLSVAAIDGEATSLRSFQGDALLVVNVASQCGLTPQYAGLQRLHERYAQRGLRVLGFPCNQFGAQEPGSNAEIASFCETSYGVTFPMFEKLEVNGEGRHPLYRALIEAKPEPSDIQWNFEKFLIDRNGRVVERFAPAVTPEDPTLQRAIEAALGS